MGVPMRGTECVRRAMQRELYGGLSQRKVNAACQKRPLAASRPDVRPRDTHDRTPLLLHMAALRQSASAQGVHHRRYQQMYTALVKNPENCCTPYCRKIS